jgi:hypothetical protein
MTGTLILENCGNGGCSQIVDDLRTDLILKILQQRPAVGVAAIWGADTSGKCQYCVLFVDRLLKLSTFYWNRRWPS